jgi:predicted nucleotidyltransferase
MVAIWNSVAMNSATKSSDIDLFIVSSPNRLWIIRIFVTFIIQVLWVRKTKNKHKARFCLSFFCSINALNFEDIAIENDIYLYFWILYLKPILNYNNTFELFIAENKKWCDFDDYKNIIKNNKNYISYKKNTSKYNCKLLNLLENILKSIFLPKTKKSFKSLWNSFWVIINDNMLKFHNNDIREKIRNKIIN